MKKQYWGIVSLLSILALELLTDNALVSQNWRQIFCAESVPKTLFFYLAILGFVLSFWVNRKDINISKFKNILKILIKNTISGNVLDILFVVFFLLHLTWVPDSIFDVVKEGDVYNLCHPFVFLAGLVLAILSKPVEEKDRSKKPLVLMTGISDIRADNTTLLKPFMEYDTFEKVIVFIDEEIKIENESIANERLTGYSANKELIESFVVNELKSSALYQNKTLSVEFLPCNYFDLKEAYDTIARKIEHTLDQKYQNKQLLFNLTPGNKYISIALSLHSIKGDRQYCYIRQTDGKLETKTLEIFEVKDIFSELTE